MKFFKVGIACCLVGLTLSTVGCMQRGAGQSNLGVASTQTQIIYTYGDAPSYDRQLDQGTAPMKLGAISAEQLPGGFPRKFLEADGSYGGGRVFRSVEEAEIALHEAEEKNIIPKGENWGIYQVEGDWAAITYEINPHDYRLRQSARVVKRVK
jgi:hypothetical protein